MPPVELVVTDLDGTLWSYDSLDVPHDSTLAAWRELERRGIPVLVATGRRVGSTRDPLAAIGFAPSAVVLNGALAVDLATGERFHAHHHDADVAIEVLAAFRAHGLDPCVYIDHPDIDVYVTATPSTSVEHLAALGSRAVVADLDEIVATTPVLSFGVFGHTTTRLTPVADLLDSRAAAYVVADTWSDGSGITITPMGLSKWTGVLVYCARHGIDPSRVLAIGDETNDVELLTHAGVSLAMADGHPDAIVAANHVVPSTNEGGWAAILDFV